jgi:hexosaminidase
VNSMYARLEYVSRWLDAYGLTHNTNYTVMLARMTGEAHVFSLRTFADLVEPVKGYARWKLATSEPTSLTPLNRVVDAARPESAAARHFGELVNQFVLGQIHPGTESQIRSQLAAWRDNDMQLGSLAEKSSFVQEVMPLSRNLSALAVAGLQALDYMDRGERAPDAWKAQQLQLVQQATQPKAQLLLMVAAPVEKLIQASAGEKPANLSLPQNTAE